jgi:UDP-N-acetyl-2-amino-2-deoxyglucuronate dehydrogenase
MKIWNFGIIGAGLIADFHARAIASLPNARLVGFCGTNMLKVHNLAKKYNCIAYKDYHEMLGSKEIDIVNVVTPSGAHMEPTIAAAEKGKHVICEKPLEISLDRIDRMIEAHEKAGTRLGGIFNFRYNESLKHLKSAVEGKRFGKISYAAVYIPWWRSEDYYKDSWHGTWKLDGGGALINQSIHMVDLLQYLIGPVESLSAYTATIAHDIEAEDTATAILRFKNNALGIIYGSTASFPGMPRRIEITGSRGTVVQVDNSFKVWEFADPTEADKRVIEKYSQELAGGGSSDPGAIPFEPHAKNISDFVESLETGKPFQIDGHEARKAVEIVLAIYTSASNVRPVYFNKSDK